MATLRATISFLHSAASRVVSALMRVAKRLAAPGAGPKFVVG
jgi:hypothetical protein